jgi:hypothetical protein
MKHTSIAIALLTWAAAAQAAIVGVALGSGPRKDPMPLGPYMVSLLPPDPSPIFSSVTLVPGSPPLTGPVGFDEVMSHRKIGSGWATWSPGHPPTWDDSVYAYFTSSVSIFLPPNTGAFVFYAEQSAFIFSEWTATAQDGTTVTQSIHGSAGASGFGFYGTDGVTIESITVVGGQASRAIGEFYGAQVPEPAGLACLAVGLLACPWGCSVARARRPGRPVRAGAAAAR